MLIALALRMKEWKNCLGSTETLSVSCRPQISMPSLCWGSRTKYLPSDFSVQLSDLKATGKKSNLGFLHLVWISFYSLLVLKKQINPKIFHIHFLKTNTYIYILMRLLYHLLFSDFFLHYAFLWLLMFSQSSCNGPENNWC